MCQWKTFGTGLRSQAACRDMFKCGEGAPSCWLVAHGAGAGRLTCDASSCHLVCSLHPRHADRDARSPARSAEAEPPYLAAGACSRAPADVLSTHLAGNAELAVLVQAPGPHVPLLSQCEAAVAAGGHLHHLQSGMAHAQASRQDGWDGHPVYKPADRWAMPWGVRDAPSLELKRKGAGPLQPCCLAPRLEVRRMQFSPSSAEAPHLAVAGHAPPADQLHRRGRQQLVLELVLAASRVQGAGGGAPQLALARSTPAQYGAGTGQRQVMIVTCSWQLWVRARKQPKKGRRQPS